MISEEVFSNRLVCPCGKGESEEIRHLNDSTEEHIMLCPECKERYVYDLKGVCRNHKIKMRPRGWVLKRNNYMRGFSDIQSP